MFCFVDAFQCLIEIRLDVVGYVLSILQQPDCSFDASSVCLVNCNALPLCIGDVFFCHDSSFVFSLTYACVKKQLFAILQLSEGVLLVLSYFGTALLLVLSFQWSVLVFCWCCLWLSWWKDCLGDIVGSVYCKGIM